MEIINVLIAWLKILYLTGDVGYWKNVDGRYDEQGFFFMLQIVSLMNEYDGFGRVIGGVELLELQGDGKYSEIVIAGIEGCLNYRSFQKIFNI